MDKAIYMVGGSKGGVGKSMVTMALIHFLTARGEDVVVVDADTSNPDVMQNYESEIQCEGVNLDDADGWIRLVNLCDENGDKTVIVNTAARNNQGVGAYGVTLSGTLEELQRRLVTLWVVNRQRDSLELLQDFLEAIPNSTVHVVKNGYFGADEKFELYNGSKTRKAIEGRGGKSLLFPDMADRVSDDLYSKRLSIRKALADMPIGNRAELKRWLAQVDGVFSAVVPNG
ncbi:MAG: protein mobD [Methylocystis sp.]|nr:MAG: protein mobD [Methylocystis sp.]